MRNHLPTWVAVVLLASLAACGGSDPEVALTTTTTPILTTHAAATTLAPAPAAAPDLAPAETAPFHAVRDGATVVRGTGKCNITGGGTDPEGGEGWLVVCELDMSDPRVSGTETQDRFRFPAGSIGFGDVWVAEEAHITNDGGSWLGSAQGAEDPAAIPIGEAHYIGEGAYNGLEYHYYFFDHEEAPGEDFDYTRPEFHGWISPTAPAEKVVNPATASGELFTVAGYNQRQAAVGWSSDGGLLITLIDGMPSVWDADSGERLEKQDSDHISGASVIVWSPNGTLVDGAADEGPGFFDAVTGEKLLGPIPEFLAFSPDGTRAAVGGAWGAAAILDAATGEEETLLPFCPGPYSWVWDAAWSPDGTRIATTCGAEVRVWDATTGDELLTVTSNAPTTVWGGVVDVEWSPDGTQIASVTRNPDGDDTAEIWDSTTGDELVTATGHTGAMWAVEWSPDGTRIATAGANGSASLWDAGTGDELAVFSGHTAAVTDVAWSPDGTRLATASLDGTIKVWSVD